MYYWTSNLVNINIPTIQNVPRFSNFLILNVQNTYLKTHSPNTIWNGINVVSK